MSGSARARVRVLVRFHDPAGVRYGIPTYPWGWAPNGLATRRQLRALGLRPGGQSPAGQIRWMRYRQERIAYLYRIGLAAPVRPMTPTRWAAVAAAVAARRVCPACQADAGYVIPGRYGVCLDCADRLRIVG